MPILKHDFKKFPELRNNQFDELYFVSPHRQITGDFNCVCTAVHDGDTIKVRWSERDFEFPIRMSNISAPELKGKFGRVSQNGTESRDWLAGRILNQDIRVEVDLNNRVEKWGRLLGRVTHQGIDLGVESILHGHSKEWSDRHSGVIRDLKLEVDF